MATYKDLHGTVLRPELPDDCVVLSGAENPALKSRSTESRYAPSLSNYGSFSSRSGSSHSTGVDHIEQMMMDEKEKGDKSVQDDDSRSALSIYSPSLGDKSYCIDILSTKVSNTHLPVQNQPVPVTHRLLQDACYAFPDQRFRPKLQHDVVHNLQVVVEKWDHVLKDVTLDITQAPLVVTGPPRYHNSKQQFGWLGSWFYPLYPGYNISYCSDLDVENYNAPKTWSTNNNFPNIASRTLYDKTIIQHLSLHSGTFRSVAPGKKCGEQGTTPRNVQNPPTSRSYNGSTKRKSISNGKGLALDGDDHGDEGDGEGKDDRENNDDRSKKRQKNFSPRLMACPFWKRDPLNYERCSKFKFDTWQRHREHLKNKHEEYLNNNDIKGFRNSAKKGLEGFENPRKTDLEPCEHWKEVYKSLFKVKEAPEPWHDLIGFLDKLREARSMGKMLLDDDDTRLSKKATEMLVDFMQSFQCESGTVATNSSHDLNEFVEDSVVSDPRRGDQGSLNSSVVVVNQHVPILIDTHTTENPTDTGLEYNSSSNGFSGELSPPGPLYHTHNLIANLASDQREFQEDDSSSVSSFSSFTFDSTTIASTAAQRPMEMAIYQSNSDDTIPLLQVYLYSKDSLIEGKPSWTRALKVLSSHEISTLWNDLKKQRPTVAAPSGYHDDGLCDISSWPNRQINDEDALLKKIAAIRSKCTASQPMLHLQWDP